MLTRILFVLTFVSICSTPLLSQNLFKVKVEGCNTDRFCLDCGSPKASYDEAGFSGIISSLNSKYNLKGVRGRIAFQVLVDSLGQPCVLSHTDESKNRITLDIIQYLNTCRWTAAIDDGKSVRSSVNVIFSIGDGRLTGSIERVDQNNLSANIRSFDTPVIYNKRYKYENPSLGTYDITVWQAENSGLPQDLCRNAVIDKDGILWCSTINGMATFDGSKFTRLTESNSPFKATQMASSIALDQDDNKWIATADKVFMFDNKKWNDYTPEETKADGSIASVTCTPFGEELICTTKGLFILKGGHWGLLPDQVIKQLPTSDIDYAYRDRQRRLWIGTFKGSIMIDSNQQVTVFNLSETPLKGTSITGIAEDDAGNLYFSLYDYINKGRHNPNEGFAILSGDGKWRHVNDENSGLPSDHINSLLFDPFEHLLWIASNESGLVRWDLKDGWEVYHSKNSGVPNPLVFDLSQGSKGNIYAATNGGIIRISRK
jgi:hypothetical protein